MTQLNTHTPREAVVIRKALPADAAAVGGALASAFFQDPVFRWGYPDDDRRRHVLPTFFELFAEAYIPHGESYVLSHHAGGALWLPPGSAAMDAAQAQAFGLRLAALPGRDGERVIAVATAIDEHHPSGDYYYLQFVGVRNEAQGRGLGTQLLRHVLRCADAQGVGTYLEATSPDNRRLYERLGFEAEAPLPIAGCPPIWPMWRLPGATRLD